MHQTDVLPAPGPEGGVGRLNESSLHAALKRWYVRPGDLLEAEVDGYVVDIVREDTLIEVQTRGFGALCDKLRALLDQHRVLLVHPIPRDTWIVTVSPDTGELLRRRRSPRRGHWLNLFDEVVRLPTLIAHPNLELEALLVQVNEYRCADGRGSWRRRGVSVVGRELIAVLETRRFSGPQALAALLPEGLRGAFTSRQLAQQARLSLPRARRVTYSLEKMGALERLGRRGRELLFARSPDCAAASGLPNAPIVGV